MVYLLDERLIFPNPEEGEPNGLLAVGGDLSQERLRLAYHHGIFPWFDFRKGVIEWWCPMMRFVIFPNEIHISHSMRTLLNKKKYAVTFNKDFRQVIENCGKLRIDLEGAWLGPQMTEVYIGLHQNHMAASVEVWEGEKLVGGLYGVTIGRCFIGESMFSLVPSGSKVALIALAQYMAENDGVMIDCQLHTKHLESMGGRFIRYEEYMEFLNS